MRVYTHAYIHTHRHTRFLLGLVKLRKNEGEKRQVGIQGILNSKEVLQKFYYQAKTKHVILKNRRKLVFTYGSNF